MNITQLVKVYIFNEKARSSNPYRTGWINKKKRQIYPNTLVLNIPMI